MSHILLRLSKYSEQYFFKVLYLLIFLLVMYPYLRTGFYNDDASNSYIDAILQLRGLTTFEYAISQVKSWLNQSGRFIPVAMISQVYLWAYVFKYIALYKSLLILGVLANIWLFSALLRSLNQPSEFIRLFMLMILLLFQLRTYHDSIASYGLVYQIVLSLGLLPCLFLVRFLTNRKFKNLLFAWLIYLFGVFFYEMSLVWLLVFPVVAYAGSHQKSQSLRQLFYQLWIPLSGFFMIVLSYILMIIIIRSTNQLSYSGTQFSLSGKFLLTAFFQAMGAFPFTALISNPWSDYSYYPNISEDYPFFKILNSIDGLGWRIGVLSSCTIYAFYLTLKSLSSENSKSTFEKKLVLILSIIILVAPSIFISLSQKYQTEVVSPKFAYLPVYLSCFGVATGLTLLIGAVVQNSRLFNQKACLVTISLLFGSALSANTIINEVQSERLNLFWKYPRDLYLESIDLGLMKDIPDRSIVFHKREVKYSTPWMTADIPFSKLNKTLEFKSIENNLYDEFIQTTALNKTVYYIQWSALNQRNGWVILHQLEGKTSNDHMKIMVHYDVFPSQMYLEDALGHKLILDSKYVLFKKQGWVQIDLDSSIFEWKSLRLKVG